MREIKKEGEWIKLPPGIDIEKFLELKPGDREDLIRLNDACKKQPGRPIRDALLFGVALALGIVLFQFGFYQAGIVGRDFLSVNVQMSEGSAPPGPADQIANDGGNSGK